MAPRKHFEDALATFLKACAYEDRRDRFFGQHGPGRRPFVTIAREAGAGGRSLSHALADALNQRDDTTRWRAFDRELVEKVAADHQISETLVESLEKKTRSWLDELLVSGPESSFGVYRRVAATIRALAEVGGAVIVGRGGVFVTEGLPGGIHIRLVAPLEYRVRRVAKREGLTEKEAARVVREIDAARVAFFRRWWPKREVGPDAFALTLDAGALDENAMLEKLLTLIPARVGKSH